MTLFQVGRSAYTGYSSVALHWRPRWRGWSSQSLIALPVIGPDFSHGAALSRTTFASYCPSIEDLERAADQVRYTNSVKKMGCSYLNTTDRPRSERLAWIFSICSPKRVRTATRDTLSTATVNALNAARTDNLDLCWPLSGIPRSYLLATSSHLSRSWVQSST